MKTTETKMKLGYLGTVNSTDVDPEKLIELFRDADPTDKDVPDMVRNDYIRMEIEGDVYFLFYICNHTHIYIMLPMIEDDTNFHWKEKRVRNHTLYMAQIKASDFRFNICYQKHTGFTSVSVKEGRFEIGYYVLRSPENKDIVNSIREWIDDYKAKVLKLAV